MEDKFQEILDNGYSFNLNKFMSAGWDIFKNGAGSFIGFTIIYFILSFCWSFIQNMIVSAAGVAVGQTLGIVAQVALGILGAGFYIYARQVTRQKAEFGDFFKGFQYTGKIVLYNILIALIFAPILILFFIFVIPFEQVLDMMSGTTQPQFMVEEIMATMSANSSVIMILALVLGIIAIYISLSYMLVMPILVDTDLSAWNSMELSRRIVGKKFFSFFGMILLLGLILVIGAMITCGIGIIVLMPFLYCTIFAAYDHILKPHDDLLSQEIDSFGQQNQDINTESEESRSDDLSGSDQ